MAHPNKFVSVNLNKSYGKPTNSSYASSARARSGSSTSAGGGMVVLSRPRSSSFSAQKSCAPKLSVPPPLNLPSLRKENEKFDLSSSTGSSARPGSSGIGSGPGSSSMGWTKPAPALLQEEAPLSGRSEGSYMPPPATRGVTQVAPSSSPLRVAEKAVFLRGDDFPSLKATVTTGSSKQKDSLNQNEKVKEDEREKPEVHSPLRMRPQMRSSRPTASNVTGGSDRSPNHDDSEQSRRQQQQQGQQEKYFPSPLPLVKLTHTSDWADDERDTGLHLPERDRDRGLARMEFNRDLEREAVGSVPSKEFFREDSFGRRGDRDAEFAGIISEDFYKGDSFSRGDLIGSNKDSRDAASSWRMPLSSQPRVDRISQKPIGMSREVSKNNNYSHFPYGTNTRDGFNNGSPDSRFTRRDLGFAVSNQSGKSVAEGFSGRGTEQQNMRGGQYGDFFNNRYRADNTYQKISAAKTSFSYGNKGLSLNDPILNFGRDKKLNSSNSGKSYLADANFDGTDPFTDDPIADVNMKVFKRKKETQRQDDFHDPVRESFEAELERVQRIQEQERKKVLEEQQRVIEITRREQEERERLAREEEERRRLIEEEAREAAWRAEQERMEAVRRVEEQKFAREEEKRRMLLEEERRKEAARQKLLELEARIARRQSETNQSDDNAPSAVSDERVPPVVEERDTGKITANVGDWEDGERMVEHITGAASDSTMNRYFDTGSSRFPPLRDAGSTFTERGKHGNYWKRDAYDSGTSSTYHLQDPESEYRGLRRDAFINNRSFSRKDNYGGHGTAPNMPSARGGISEHSLMPDDFHHLRGNGWNFGDDADHFARNLDVDAGDYLDPDKFGNVGWTSSHPRESPNASYTERSFQTSEVDGGFPSYGRSRHFLRQPRVLPPPSISSIRQSRNSFRSATTRPIPSSFVDSQFMYPSERSEEVMQSGYVDGYHQRVQQPRTPELLESHTISSEQKEENISPRCDSQSSLSVSNPPSSPTQLSHDELDEADDSQALQAAVDEQASDNEHMVTGLGTEDTNILVITSSASQVEDDEWAIGNNEEMQELEEYYEDHDYHEENDAAHAGDGGGSSALSKEFDDATTSNVPKITDEIFGFDDGVEVSIPISDDLEEATQNFDEAIEVQEDSVGDHSLQIDNSFIEEAKSESSKILNETEKALQDLVINSVPSSSGNLSDNVEATGADELQAQQPTTSMSLPMPSTTIQPVSSTVSTVDSLAESSVRLQFGLFTGPSLIPSPVPAIQIGSIQMPLHLPPQLGTSIPQMQPPQSPLFQFGQLRYPSPLSQGILPLVPQSVSFVQSPAPNQYSSSQILGSSSNNQASQGSSLQSNPIGKAPSRPAEEQSDLLRKPLNLCKENTTYQDLNEWQDQLKTEVASQGQVDISEGKPQYVLGNQNDRHVVHEVTSRKNYRPIISNKESHTYSGHVQGRPLSGTRVPGIISTSRGKKVAYTVRSAGTGSSFLMPENSGSDSSVFQRKPRRNVRRTEFRVRENADKRQEGLEYINASQDGRPYFNVSSAVSGRYGARKDSGLNKLTKTPIESGSLSRSTPQVASSDGKIKDKHTGREGDALSKKRVSSLESGHIGGENGKNNKVSEEDVYASLQSGVVRIFKQAGIEAPSDDDDFIQVRSKRQMLNDRREQREKEIKAKSKAIKAPRKHRAAAQSNSVMSKSKKALESLGGNSSNNVSSDPVISGRRGFATIGASHVFTANVTSQSLPPIGTPPVKADSDTRSGNLKGSHASTIPVIVGGPTKCVRSPSSDNKNTALVNASLALGSWSNVDLNQQVMALTQSQFDDAMKPVQFDSQVASSISLEPSKSSASIMAQEKPFSPSASPLNSLLAGERIQFGAVTSPTILPPVSRAITNGIAAPGSSRSDVSKENSTAAKNDHELFLDKVKHPGESCADLEDSEAEAEAEAAASAVAVAAISNNDVIAGNRIGVCSISDSKSFSSADSTELRTSRGGTDSQLTGQSVAEESLTVSLPADLSVETSSLPLWHPVPSPRSTSGLTISHFSGGHSHFPMGFDMNPIFGGPIFAFGPHDESGSAQLQQQRSTTLSSGPLGAWPQCHSGVDSFYGPQAGFTGPYISPPGGIPGVQAPPHMLVYNHFAPVGQYGQVGLSFMSTAYIPTGKQPDWKHNPVSSATVGVCEGDNSNNNVVSGQRNPSTLHSPMQHLATGSPLMPMASPLAMFDMSPFQSSADIMFQARWSHVPIPPMQQQQQRSVPLTMPPPPPPQQQQHQKQPPQQVEDVVMPPQLISRGISVGTSSANDMLKGTRPDTSAIDGSRSSSFSVAKNEGAAAGARPFPNELHLMGPPTSSTSTSNMQSNNNSSKGSNNSKTTLRSAVGIVNQSGVGNGGDGQNPASSFFKQPANRASLQQQPASSGQQQQRYLQPIGSGDQREAPSHNHKWASGGGEWNRKLGYQVRGQGSGSDKGFPASKMKQIYVAKSPAASAPPTTG